ncbi:MAG: hypothetical protein IKY26_04035 [Erysipelotrichaceae bacterium]|nr:hypothetical protein [Erysipelotrichaceae bacterium]
MSGTKLGGKKAALTNIARNGFDFYKKIGSKGGKNGHTGGFYANRELAREAGRKGGLKSRRTGVKNGEGKRKVYYEDERVNYQSY